MTRTQYKRRTIAYWILLAVYALVLAVITVFVWSIARTYAMEYENSQADNVVDAYIEQLNEDHWSEGMEDSAKVLQNDFQSADECVEIVKNSLEGSIQLSQINDIDFTKEKYRIICNDREIGQVVFCEDESAADDVKFGMLPWILESETFNFDYMVNGSATATVPSTYSVKINNQAVGEEYITEKDIPYDVIEEYYDDYEGLPTKVKYEVSGLVGNLTPVVYDEDGNEFTVDPNSNDSQFLEPCPESEISRLQDFINVFIEPYAKFSGTANFDATYPEVKQYVKSGSELANRLQQFYEGGSSWINWTGCTVDSIVLDGAYSLGGDFYVIDVTYNTTNYHTYKDPVQEENQKRIVVVDDGTQVLAVSVE